MARFDTFHPVPPPERPTDLEVVDHLVQQEAWRQLDLLVPYTGKALLPEEKRSREIHFLGIRAGIRAMLSTGAAQVFDFDTPQERIEFWNPETGQFQPYDRPYNETMIAFRQHFNEKYYQHVA